MLFDISVTVKVMYIMKLFQIVVKLIFLSLKQSLDNECSNTSNVEI